MSGTASNSRIASSRYLIFIFITVRIISNRSLFLISILGHWYDQVNRNKPIETPNVLVQPGESKTFNVAGKILAPELASATGQLDIVREIQGQQGGQKREQDVARVQFDSSFSNDNRFRVRLFDDEMFSTNQPDWNEKGVLGRLHLKIHQHNN